MYTQILILETYTNSILCNSDIESNRTRITDLDLYMNGEEYVRYYINEYIELDRTVGKFYYENANIYKFSNPKKTTQILQIVFDDETFNSMVINEALNIDYYDSLRTMIWVELLGVNQEILVSSSKNEIPAFTTFDEALAGITAIKLSAETIKSPT